MNTATQLTLPPVGTVVELEDADIGLSADSRTYMTRIKYDRTEDRWVVASRLNQSTMRWVPVVEEGPIGLMVFLNDGPDGTNTNLVVSAIKRSGRAVYGDLKIPH